MSKTFLLLIFPVIIFAGSINLSLKNHNGQSSYIVQSPSQNLKSELIFPFKFNSIDIDYNHSFKYFDITLNSSFFLNDKTTTGKDYDWHNNNLTVFSESDNEIDKYYDLGLTVSKNIYNNTNLFIGFNYKVLDMHWSDTYQEDYVKDKNEYISGRTLKFQQEFFIYSVGIDYNYNISNKIIFNLKPIVMYAFINTKDTHILRDFYTIQNTQSIGYEIPLSLIYKLTFNSNVTISYKYSSLEDKDVDMDYYNSLNEKFSSFPSSYKYKNSIVGISYSYNF